MLIDIHCHLTDAFFSDKLESVINKSIKNNVSLIVSAGLNSEDNKKVLEISKSYDMIKAALGFYPLDAEKFSMESIEDEINFIKKNKNKVFAISEVGLDKMYGTDIKKQKEVFLKFIDLAEKMNKPIIVHSRKAELEVIEMLESSKIKNIVLHSFSGNKSLIKRAINNKYFFSIPPVIVRSSNYQTLVELVPLGLLLTESDSPYQSPFKEEKNFPYLISESIKKISEIKKLDLIETENIIMMNFQNFSKKWKSI